MPLVIVTLLLAALLGRFAPRRVALSITGVAALVTVIAFVRAATDGVGNDPWWIVIVAVVGCGIALLLADRMSRSRVGADA